jgi:hypothetical protein
MALEEYLETLAGLLPDIAQVRKPGAQSLRNAINPVPSTS